MTAETPQITRHDVVVRLRSVMDSNSIMTLQVLEEVVNDPAGDANSVVVFRETGPGQSDPRVVLESVVRGIIALEDLGRRVIDRVNAEFSFEELLSVARGDLTTVSLPPRDRS